MPEPQTPNLNGVPDDRHDAAPDNVADEAHATFRAAIGDVRRAEEEEREVQRSISTLPGEAQFGLERVVQSGAAKRQELHRLDRLLSRGGFLALDNEDRRRRISEQYGSSFLGKINALMSGAYIKHYDPQVTALEREQASPHQHIAIGANIPGQTDQAQDRSMIVTEADGVYQGGPSVVEEAGVRLGKTIAKTAVTAGIAGVAMTGLAALGGFTLPAFGVVAGGMAAGRLAVEAVRMGYGGGKERKLRNEIENANRASLLAIQRNYQETLEKRRSLKAAHPNDSEYSVDTDPEYVGMLVKVVELLNDDSKRRVKATRINGQDGYVAVENGTEGDGSFTIAEKQAELRKMENTWETVANIASAVTGVGISAFTRISVFLGTTLASGITAGWRPAMDKLFKADEKNKEAIAEQVRKAKNGIETVFPTRDSGGATPTPPEPPEGHEGVHAPEQEKQYDWPDEGTVIRLSANAEFRSEIPWVKELRDGFVEYFEFHKYDTDENNRPTQAVLIPLRPYYNNKYLRRDPDQANINNLRLINESSIHNLDAKHFEQGKKFWTAVENNEKELTLIPVGNVGVEDETGDGVPPPADGDEGEETPEDETGPETIEEGKKYPARFESIEDAPNGKIKVKIADIEHVVTVTNYGECAGRLMTNPAFNLAVTEVKDGEITGSYEEKPAEERKPGGLPELFSRGGKWQIREDVPLSPIHVKVMRKNVDARGRITHPYKKEDTDLDISADAKITVNILSTDKEGPHREHRGQIRIIVNGNDDIFYAMPVSEFLKRFKPSSANVDQYKAATVWAREEFGDELKITDDELYKYSTKEDDASDFDLSKEIGADAKEYFETHKSGKFEEANAGNLAAYAEFYHRKEELGYYDEEIEVKTNSGERLRLIGGQGEGVDTSFDLEKINTPVGEINILPLRKISDVTGWDWEIKKFEPEMRFIDKDGNWQKIKKGQTWNAPPYGSINIKSVGIYTDRGKIKTEIIMEQDAKTRLKFDDLSATEIQDRFRLFELATI